MASIGSIFATEMHLHQNDKYEQAKREIRALVTELHDQYKAERIRVARLEHQLDVSHKAEAFLLDRVHALEALCREHGIDTKERKVG